jgi:fermentation-respiration switch protein FrsA (DUF1100 family)
MDLVHPNTVPSERVDFTADGVNLVGQLRLPDAEAPVPAPVPAPASTPAPGLVFTGPFTGVKDQVVGVYADRLAQEGYATLAFDHRGFGESGGRRGHEDSQGKLADLRAAVDLLTSRADVDPDRVGVVGVCLGGGYAVRAAATDPRVKVVAGIAGAYNSPAWFAERMSLKAYRSALGAFLARYDEFLPAVAPDGGEAAMGGDEPYAYYGTARSASPHWENQVTRGSLHSLMTFDALGAAALLGATPLLVVHGKVDAYCAPELATQLHAQATGPKEFVWLDCHEHIDLYDVEPYVTQAVEVTADFLRRHL